MAEQRSAIEDHVTCSICMDLYDDPIALPCMHSFCRRCVTGIHSSSLVLKCPECRKDTKLGKGGVNSLPRNFQLGCIVDSYKTEHQSALPKLLFCTEHRIMCQVLCETCKQSICVSCISERKHTGHVLTISDGNKISRDVDVTRMCRKHSRETVLYCNDCKSLVCLECLITAHTQHSTQAFDVVYDSLMKQFDVKLEELESRQRLLKATQKSCRTIAQKVQIDSQRKHNELSVYFGRLRDALDKKETQLKQELQTREKHAVERYLGKADESAKKELRLVDVMNDMKRLLTEDKRQVLEEHRKITHSAGALLVSEEEDSTPRVRGLDGNSLQTCSLDEQLSNIKWRWSDDDIKPLRKAPPIPAQRMSKSILRPDSIRTPSLKPGSHVKRGRHWKDGMKDGGPGHFGTITQTTIDSTVYLVRWPNGNTGSYKYIPELEEEISPS